MTDENEPVAAEQPDPGVQSSAILEAGGQQLATPEDVAAFQDQFMRLLERRTAIYTMGDSTSVPRYVAADMLRSICFVLGIDLDDPTVPERLLHANLEDEFRRHLAEIERKIPLSEKLWQDVIATMPPIANIALRDTLVEIGEFPKRYDFRSMAHEIPCSIDYPLCHPVPETLVGVDYINEYLLRLLIEADFLQCFELDACVRVLECSSPDYVDLLVNLYEPIATNAIGLAFIGKDPTPLKLAEKDRLEIARRLRPLSGTRRGRVLRGAAADVCDRLDIEDDAAREYLGALVPELLPRIDVGLARGNLRGVFVG